MRRNNHLPQVYLLVQGTGGGESTACQGIGSVDAGMTLVIENALSLRSDQLSKVEQASASGEQVEAFQLDSIKTPTLCNDLNMHL